MAGTHGVTDRTGPELAKAWRAPLAELRRGRVAVVPRLAGLEGAVAVRAFYRHWLDTTRAWAPLFAVDVAVLPEHRRAELVAHCSTTFLHLYGGRPADLDALAERCATAGGAVVLLGEVEVTLDVALVRRLAALDAVHGTATDPTLVLERERALAFARGLDVVHVRGPAGSGRASLCRWAALELGYPDPVERAAGATDPGGVVIWRDVHEASDAPPRRLLERLSPRRPRRLVFPSRGSRPAHPAFGALLGHSEALCAVLRMAERAAPGGQPVLVLGETGVGKEPLARAIHAASGRRGPLVTLDLASRAENLVEDDLFGHVAGAFNGASRDREGALRAAHGGTLFLDEIGNLSLGLQAKLLRILEGGEAQPLGSDVSRRVDVRVIAATNVDIESQARAGRFRLDLLHRLGGTILRVPPLRERPGDLALLAQSFLADAGGENLLDGAIDVLEEHHWPGNVRELKRVIEAVVREVSGEPIGREMIERRLEREGPVFCTATSGGTPLPPGLQRTLDTVRIDLDGPAARGDASLRNALGSLFWGRLVARDAMALLAGAPWWGHFPELEACARVVAATREPVVEGELVRGAWPMDATERFEPILVAESPIIELDRLARPVTRFETAGVVVGRARGAPDLEDDRVAATPRWRRLDALLRSRPTGYVSLPHVAELGRAHVVVIRDESGLVVHMLPGGSMRVLAAEIGSPLRPVEEGAPVRLGEAGELRLLREPGPGIHLALFLGEAALADAIEVLAERPPERLPPTAQPVEPRRAWELSADEIALLNGIVEEAVRGDLPFASHLRKRLAALGAGESDRLRHYLLSSHPTQSCARLYEHPMNSELRSDLRRRVAGWAVGAQLPARIGAALGLRVGVAVGQEVETPGR